MSLTTLSGNNAPGSQVGPLTQASTSTYTVVAGSVLDLADSETGNAVYVVQETGDTNGITFKVQASLDQVTWFDVITYSTLTTGLQASGCGDAAQPVSAGTAVVVNGANFSGSLDPIAQAWPGRYLQIVIKDTNSGSHGTAQVNGFCK